MTRSGEPPRTAAVTGSSTGSNGEFTSEITARSACLPGTSDPIRSSIPSTRAPPSVASSSASAAVSASGLPSRARAPTIAVRISSKRSSDGVDAGLSVAIDTATPASRSSRERCDAAAEVAVRARAMRDADAVPGQEVDLLGVGMHAVRRHQARARAVPPPPACGSRSRRTAARGTPPAGSSRPGRRRASRARRRSRRSGSPAAGRARRTRGRSRSCRCTARAARRRGARGRRAPLDAPVRLVEPLERRPVAREDLEVDDRAQAGRGRGDAAAPEKLQSPIVVTPDRRHSCAPTVAISTMSSNVSAALR